MWLIQWAVKGTKVWNYWGGPYKKGVAASIIRSLSKKLLKYRKYKV